jgi:hypothetical protein
MTLNNYIHEQLAAAHGRDLFEAAERERLAVRVRQPRERFRLALGRRGLRRPADLDHRVCAPSPRTVTR